MKNDKVARKREGRLSLILSVCSLAVPLAVVAVDDLTLVGSSDVNWNTTDAVWTNSNGSSVAFTAGDNVRIDSTSFTGSSLMMTERVKPGDVVFDIDSSLSFGWSGANTYGLHVDTKSFTKRGNGTLIFTSSPVTSSSDTAHGNAMTCGVDIVEGEIALKEANCHAFLGPRTVPYWVHVRNGASLSFFERNQTGAYNSSECGICIDLETGGRINLYTNRTSATSSSLIRAVSVNTLKLCGGDIVTNEGLDWYYDANSTTDRAAIGGKCLMKIFNTLWFSGSTPHAFGVEYPGCKTYSYESDLKSTPISLNAASPVEFKVDNITGDEDVDAYVNMKMFTWGQNDGVYRSDIVKTGAGTLCFPTATINKTFLGDFTVKEGTAVFTKQGFFPADGSRLQTLTVSTNGTLRMTIRNVVAGAANLTPNVRLVVDHGRFEFIPESNADHGALRAREFVFNDATLDIRNKGFNSMFGVFCFMGSAVFRGSSPYVLSPCTDLDTNNQIVSVFNSPRTTFDVDDITGDAQTDVTMGYPICNYSINGSDPAGIQYDSGFVKIGTGTFSVAGVTNRVSGVVTVSNGTMRVDGELVTPSSVEVAAGAYLGGTGTVANVNLERGAGFAAPMGQRYPLTVQGNLNLPETGRVEIAMPDGVESSSVGMASLVTATGTITGIENLANWTVTINGAPAESKWMLYMLDGVVKAKRVCGFVISLH